MTASTMATALEETTGLEELESKAGEAEELLSLLANRRRLLILCHLITDGELPVGELVRRVNLAQSALSQHLALLRQANIVSTRRDGTTIYYAITDERAKALIGALKDILCPTPGSDA